MAVDVVRSSLLDIMDELAIGVLSENDTISAGNISKMHKYMCACMRT